MIFQSGILVLDIPAVNTNPALRIPVAFAIPAICVPSWYSRPLIPSLVFHPESAIDTVTDKATDTNTDKDK